LAKQVEVADKFPTAGLIFCNTDYIDEEGRKLGSHLSSFALPDSFIRKGMAGNLLLIKGCYVDSEACFIKASLVSSLGPLDESLRYSCDYEFFIRAGLTCDFAYTRETLAAWRIHPAQESAMNRNRFKEYRSVLMRFFVYAGVDLRTRLIIILNLGRSHGGEAYRGTRNFFRKLRLKCN
jgi:hypothetical protein